MAHWGIYGKQVNLFKNTLLQFCQFELIEKIQIRISKFDYKNKTNIIAIDKKNVGIKAKDSISKFTNLERDGFIKGG